MIYMLTLDKAFVSAIISGKKTIEVRTRIPRLLTYDDILLIAQKAANGRVVLRCRVSQIIKSDPETLFKNHGQALGCSHQYYTRYTHGRDLVYGIGLYDIIEFPTRITTRTFDIERCPQWFTHVCTAKYAFVTGDQEI